jgi:hypothetical protein
VLFDNHTGSSVVFFINFKIKQIMDVVEKQIVHEYDEDRKEYASKGVAGTGLGLGIAGTALGLWALSKSNLFGNAGCAAAGALAAEAISGPSTFQAWQHSCNAELANQKALYDFALLSANARFNDRQTINSEMFGLYKSQIDADFGLYKNQRDQFDVLADRIGKLETAAAVQAAVEPWRSKVTKMEIAGVAGMVGLEAERRMCADNKIVNYANNTFYPIRVAAVEVGTDTVQRSLYNPLCPCSGYSNNILFETTTTPAA